MSTSQIESHTTSQHTRRNSLAISALALALAAGTAHAQSSWNNPSGGDWATPTNWNPTVKPLSADDVIIGLAGTYDVFVNLNQACNDLTISNANVGLGIASVRTFSVHGTSLVNDGMIVVNPTSGSSTASLRFNNASTAITGSGTIMLNAAVATNDANMTYNLATNVLTHGVNHTITGRGQILNAMTNNGLIKVDGPASQIELLNQPKPNTGLLLAMNSGDLKTTSITIDQTGGGIARADGGTISSTNSTWINGDVEGINGGTFNITGGNSTFDSVTSTGALNIDSVRTLNVLNTITNNGTITINPTGGVSSGILSFNTNPSAINGSGTIVLNAVSAINDAYLISNVGTNVMTHAASHTITGNGQIYTNMVNNGMINADGAGNQIELLTQPKTNNSMLLATNGGDIKTNGITIDQTSGGIARANASTITSTNTTWLGGTVDSINGGAVNITGGNTTYDGVTITGATNIDTVRTLNVLNSITNNGTITVNPTGGVSSAIISLNTDGGAINGTGTIVLNADPTNNLNDAYLTSNNGTFVTTHTANHTITGNGQIYNNVVNEGHIFADGVDNTIELLSQPKTNNATILASDSAEIQITGITVDQAGGGNLTADNGTVDLTSATINEGTIDTTNGGLFRVTGGNATFNDVVSTATIDIDSVRTLNIVGSITNDSLITVNPTGGTSTAIVSFNSDGGQLDGLGEIRLNAVTSINDAYITSTNGAFVTTQAPTHTISGSGQIYNKLTNKGLINANIPGKTLQLLTQNKVNNSTIRADGGTILVTSITVDQTSEVAGVMDAVNGGTVDLTNATILNGTLDVSGGQARVTGGNATLDGVTFDGPLGIDGVRTLNIASGGIVNNGTIHVNSNDSTATSSVQILDTVTIGGDGEIVLDATNGTNDANITRSNATFELTNGVTHTIAGVGQLFASINNQGTISPGHATLTGDETQSLQPTGSPTIDCGPTSVVHIQIEGDSAGEYDTINGSGAFNCAGTLVIEHLGGFGGPVWGTTIDLIDVTVVNGEFDAVQAPVLAGSDRYAIIYTSDKVQLLVTCYADCDASSSLNILDYICFGDAYAGQEPYADCDGSSSFNILDYICFGDEFAAGCP